MKLRAGFLLVLLLGAAGLCLFCSAECRQGAYNGLLLAQNTILPSLTPLLILFLLVMKTPARDVLARSCGRLCVWLFHLPHAAAPVVLLGLLGGYPTGALLTSELLQSGEIDKAQARRLLRFTFCGGAGFLVTAVGTCTLQSTRAGVLLLAANVLSALCLGVALSFGEKRSRTAFYSFSMPLSADRALYDATTAAVRSVLHITAYVMLFSALTAPIAPDAHLLPLLEITSGICGTVRFSLPLTSAYLAFGGLCIHLQLLSTLQSAGLRLWDFLLFRLLGAALSYFFCRLLLRLFPLELPVFAATSVPVRLYSVNAALSVLMVLGCFVLLLDLRRRLLRQ